MGFVGSLPENPDRASLEENGIRLELFASEFFSVTGALRESGASRVLRRYVDARQVRITGRGLGERMSLEGAHDLLEQTPEDVVEAVQDIRAAQADVLRNLARAEHWADWRGLDDLARRAKELEKEGQAEGLVQQ